MKKAVIFIVSIFMTVTLMAQESSDFVKKGTVLTLGPVSASGYKHIDFPRKNIIIKRGAIADFNNLEGRKVIVEEVQTENGTTEVVLKRKDGRNFFRFWTTVTTDIEKALAKGELKMTS
ncbi:hypothetical protein [Maribacter halichondriae]|uniref:hypothetical protein n=1 Tax=Maribacter halichondriae TaxID=2980554 RepID=UPI002359BE98|nr:hypothetical protein [Maribacter sp. Hal144]